MIKMLLCWFFGHKFVDKAFTGHTQRVLNAFRGEEDIQYYRWQNHRFCLRCGAKNRAFETAEGLPTTTNSGSTK
jgi:hypothetical protein